MVDELLRCAEEVMIGERAQGKYTCVALVRPEITVPVQLLAFLAFFPDSIAAGAPDGVEVTPKELAQLVQSLEIPPNAPLPQGGLLNLTAQPEESENDTAITATSLLLGEPDLPVGIVAWAHPTFGAPLAESQVRLWMPLKTPSSSALWRACRALAAQKYLQ